MPRLLSFLILGALSLPMVAQRTRRSPQPIGSAGAFQLPAATFRGALREITAKEIVIEPDEGPPLTLYRNRKTRFLKAGLSIDAKHIAAGARLVLDVAKNPDGSLLAVNVMVSP